MSTPWSIEFNKNMAELRCDAREIVISQDEDVIFFSITSGKCYENGDENDFVDHVYLIRYL
jgi:hypothetical protein